MKESDLFEPLKAYFAGQGYTVHAEVKDCDLVARKDDEIIAVELKTRMSLQLIYQSVRRQEAAESVYCAIAIESARANPPGYGRMLTLLRRLGLGLILVRFLKTRTRIEIVLHPDEPSRRNRPKRRRAIIREIDGRYAEFNKSGEASTVEKLTAYKQQALFIAACLAELEVASPAQIKKAGGPARAGTILSRNVYGWFYRPERGKYRLSEEGIAAVKRYADKLKHIRAEKTAKE